MSEKLPDGVHRLSDESIAIMNRIAQRSAEQTARFTKRGSRPGIAWGTASRKVARWPFNP